MGSVGQWNVSVDDDVGVGGAALHGVQLLGLPCRAVGQWVDGGVPMAQWPQPSQHMQGMVV